MAVEYACAKFEAAPQLERENSRQTKSQVRLVGPMCERRACARVLRIGIC
jgi:hypothetical protein